MNNNTYIPDTYEGNKPYIFISYSHKDSNIIWSIIQKLNQDGFRIWYDNGIHPGSEWDKIISSKISNAKYFIAFISKNYLVSENCKDELKFARDKISKRLICYIEKVSLPDELEMRLGRLQYIEWYKFHEKKYFFEKLYMADEIKTCQKSNYMPNNNNDLSLSKTSSKKIFLFEKFLKVCCFILLTSSIFMIMANNKFISNDTLTYMNNVSYDISISKEIITFMNEERSNLGKKPLKINNDLISLAKIRAEEISRSFSHERPDGSNCFTIFDDNNMKYVHSAENIAAGNSTMAQTFFQWKESPGHYKNMMNSDFTEFGMACFYSNDATYKYYWVQLFAG